MRVRIFFLMLCAAITLAGCSQPEKKSPSLESGLIDYERDAIPNNVPLPKPGVNQRPIVGAKSVLLSVVNWKGESTLDKAVFEKLVLSGDNSLATFINVASKGKLTLHGQAIAHTSSDPRPEICKSGVPYPFDLATAEGEKAARAHGLDQSKFDYIINVIDCRGGGQAYTPGRLLNIYGEPYLGIFAHEFGHSLGYDHGYTYTGCLKNGNTVTTPDGCSKTFLGDSGDPVSGGSAIFPPMHNRWYSGWLSSSQVKVVDRSGRYLIGRTNASVTPITPPQLLLINRNTPPTQISMEYRGTMMFDNFPPGDNRTTGVWVRFTTMGNIVSNIQLDSTPETTSTNDPTLQPGRVLRDEASGITVMVCGPSGDNISVAISLNNEPMPHCNS